MRIIKALLLAGLLLLQPAPVAAELDSGLPETPRFSRFGTAEGLPSSRLRALAQDAEGYLWIGTQDGLARYDGLGFAVHRFDSARPEGLAANNVQALHVDAQGRLWVASEGGGLSRLLDAGTGRFEHLRSEAHPQLPAQDFFAIAHDAEGALWFGGFATGLYRLQPESGQLQHHAAGAEAGALADNTVLSLHLDRSGRLWIGGMGGLCEWLGDGFRCQPPPAEGARGAWVWSITDAPDGALWVGTTERLLRFVPDAGEFEPVPGLATGNVVSLLDDGGRLWAAQPAGLASLRGERWRRYPAGPDNRAVLAMLRDHEGGLWFASDGNGLLRLPPTWRNFSLLAADAASINAIGADGTDVLWALSGTSTLLRIGLGDGQVEQRIELGGMGLSLLRSALGDRHGQLWVGHNDGLLLRRSDGSELRFGPDSGANALPGGQVDRLLESAEGVWVAVVGKRLQLRDFDGRVVRDFRPGEAGFAGLETTQMVIGPDGGLWWSGAEGLRHLAPGAEHFERLPGSPEERVHGFDFDAEGTLWLHRTGGLDRYLVHARGLERIERIDRSHGLPELESGGLRVDAAGDVWLTTSRGLLRYRPSRDREFAELSLFTERHGLPSSEFRNGQPPLWLPGDRIAGLTLQGAVVFEPAALRESSAPVPLPWHAISVLREGRRMPLQGPRIELRHGDSELRVALRLLSFSDPASHRYRFRLEGIDEGWTDTGANPERAYARLPAGSFRLDAAAAAADGRWVTAAPLEVRMAPAPWNTPWAWAGYVLLLCGALGLLWAGYRRRLAAAHALQLAEQARLLAQQSSAAKGRFLATLGHEVRTPMTGLLGMNELLLRGTLSPPQREQAEAVRRAARMILRLLDEALDLARVEAGRLELLPAPTALAPLLSEVVELQRPLALARGLQLRAPPPPAEPPALLLDGLRVQQILLNLVGNAIKFTDSGHVELRAGCERVAGSSAGLPRWRLWIEVEDTGPGLDAESQARLFQPFSQAEGERTARRHGGSGLGLSISRALAEAMGGSLELRSTPGLGSRFRLQLEAEQASPPASVESTQSTRPVSEPGQNAVLLVEDSPDAAAALMGLLQAQGWQSSHAEHGLAALAEVTRSRYQAVLLDLDLPGLDGFSLLPLLRARSEGVRIIALTASAETGIEARCTAAGFDGFLRKPVEGAVLAAALDACPVVQPPKS